MLPGLLVCGYASGVHGSRRIERATCEIAANASKHKALSWAHANKLEAQLRQEVQTLLALAENSDTQAVPDGMDVPAEIARREDRLSALAQAQTGLNTDTMLVITAHVSMHGLRAA